MHHPGSSIANGTGDDEKQKIENGLAPGRALLSTRPQLLVELKDRLTIARARPRRRQGDLP
jgi:hypothetical protein